MSATVVERHNLDVEVVQATVSIDVLDARIGEVLMAIEVRQVVRRRTRSRDRG